MKIIRKLIIALSIILLWTCTKSEEHIIRRDESLLTITASLNEQNDTKNILQGTSVYWEVNDAIKVFYGSGSGKFVSTNKELSRIASFKGSIDVVIGSDEGFSEGETMWGLYPYRADATYDGESVTTTLPDSQTGRAESFARNTNVSLAKSTNLALSFYNVCGGLRFSVTRDDITDVEFEGMNGEDIAGNIQISFRDGIPVVQKITDGKKKISLVAPDKKTFEKGKWYYISAIPGVLSKGFKLTLYTETQRAELVKNNEVSIKRGVFGSVSDADAGLTFVDSGRDPEPQGKDEPFFSEGVELMSLIWRLAGSSEYNRCRVADIDASVDAYFGSMKNHRAVTLAKEFRQNSSICYDAVASFGIHLAISEIGEISFISDYQEYENDAFFYRWTVQQRNQMLSAVNDFYNESGFHEWFISQEPLFQKGLEKFKLVCDVNYEWYEDFFGTLENPSHQVILSYLVGNSNYGLSVQLPDGSVMSSPVMGCARQNQQGGEIFLYDGTLDIIIHEFCHPYCNPLINKNWSSMEKKADAVYQLMIGQMESQAYSSSNTMMCETFVRASTIRYLITQASGYDRISLVKEQESLGFIMVDTLVSVLEQRELHPELYPTMDEFMPEFVKAVNEFPVSLPSGEFDEYDNPNASNLLPGLFSVGTDKKVQFTRSNLYWDGQGWKFESNPLNYPVEWNPNHVGHFYWTTTAESSYHDTYDVQQISIDDHFFCDGSDAAHTLTVEGIPNLRTFSTGPGGEIEYLLEKRNNASNLYKFPVEFEGVGVCLVIAPDDYSGKIAPYYDSNSWSIAEGKGLVCLSRCGMRLDESIQEYSAYGNYWSRTMVTEREGYENYKIHCVYPLKFSENYLTHSFTVASRNVGYSIRLVKDVQ